MGEPSAHKGVPRQKRPQSEQEEADDTQVSGLQSVPMSGLRSVGGAYSHRLPTRQNSSLPIMAAIIPIIGALRQALVTVGRRATHRLDPRYPVGRFRPKET